jgi:hypothetical protein
MLTSLGRPDIQTSQSVTTSLWGHLKSVVYQTRPTNLAQLKTLIEENIANIPENTLRRAMQNLQNRLTECVQRNGQHLTDVIFKK